MKNFKKKSWFSLKNILFLSFLIFSIANVIYSMVFHLSIFQKLDYSEQLTTYSSPIVDFSIDYPKSWNLLESRPNNDNKNIAISIKPLYGQGSLPIVRIYKKEYSKISDLEILNWGLNRIQSKECPYFESVNKTDEMIAGKTGTRIEYTCRYPNLLPFGDNPILAHCASYYLNHLDTAYDFTFCAKESEFSDAQQLFIRMVKSIRIQ